SRAGLDALLVATRRMAAPPGGHPDTVGAAGVTPRRWLLDGILRLLTGSVLAARPVEVGWADLATADQRTRWSLCTDYFDRTIRVYRRDLPGTGLVLAEVVDASGEIRVAEWGTSAASAVHLALGTAVAHAQATAGVRAQLADPPAGTRILQSARPEQLDGVLDHLRALLASQGRRPHADPLPPDPVAGAWPLSCGTVTLS
ncbi:MAG TPA: hypothetical protein VHA75_07230, partial [Rugosimonospora sp.]|nr:hypothetical protein [Rugosimonospora sp.]